MEGKGGRMAGGRAADEPEGEGPPVTSAVRALLERERALRVRAAHLRAEAQRAERDAETVRAEAWRAQQDGLKQEGAGHGRG
ncbi:MAG: hypothetical protein RQ751_11640 [Longimicrobiales bacterium]|nr:hypothetical protein [Longimicrobiales bacterium]